MVLWVKKTTQWIKIIEPSWFLTGVYFVKNFITARKPILISIKSRAYQRPVIDISNGIKVWLWSVISNLMGLFSLSPNVKAQQIWIKALNQVACFIWTVLLCLFAKFNMILLVGKHSRCLIKRFVLKLPCWTTYLKHQFIRLPSLFICAGIFDIVSWTRLNFCWWNRFFLISCYQILCRNMIEHSLWLSIWCFIRILLLGAKKILFALLLYFRFSSSLIILPY